MFIRKRLVSACVCAVTLLAIACASMRAEVHPASLFSDHMVVQQGKPIHLWGTADRGETISVTLGPDHAQVVADESGAWNATLAPLGLQPGNAALELVLKGKGSAVTIHDVLVGEVWLASGQSNMVYELSKVQDARETLAAADHPDIRMFTVSRVASTVPVKDVTGNWVVAAPTKASGFSAVAYFFALRLEASLHRPIGIFNSSVGGTPIKSWTGLRALEGNSDLLQNALTDVKRLDHYDEDVQAFPAARIAWEDKYKVRDTSYNDAKILAEYSATDADLSSWQKTDFPLRATNMKVKNGTVTWFRCNFNVDASVASTAQRINFGSIHESGIVWLNGVRIGDHGLKATELPVGQFNINIPHGLLKESGNTLVLRIFAHDAALTWFGNIPVAFAPAEASRQYIFPIKGDWYRKTEVEFPPVDQAGVDSYPQLPNIQKNVVSTVLYHGMIEPLRDYSLSGAIWYQGESDAGHGDVYRVELPLMIADWRRQWQDDWPFYIVQLPNYGILSLDANSISWAGLREAQQKVADSVPNTGLAVTIDSGIADVLHPPNKKPVGDRLALLALARLYKLPVKDSGPMYSSMSIVGNSVRIALKNAEGLNSLNDPIKNFVIAGSDQKFYPATALIEGETLVVSSREVPHPVAVRYAFTNSPDKAFLYNADGLPLAPFRTDDWKLGR